MSLFRVRDFWSFDLDQLVENYCARAQGAADGGPGDNAASQEDEKDPSAGGFIVRLGNFRSTGRHDVFVCAHLSGLICIIQVPESEQPIIGPTAQSRQSEEQARGSASSGESGPNNTRNRQMFCASQLDFPVADLKCGFFTSALKQSIAVLGFDRLIVYQVKQRPVDLLTATHPAGDQSHAALIDESLFSHKLEHCYRIDLPSSHELASNLTVFAHHHHHHLAASFSEPKSSSDSAAGESSSKRASLMRQRNKQQQLQLPQRDLIVVQYQNQFLFTLVDHKKVVGHFNLTTAANNNSADDVNYASSEPAQEGAQLSHFMGPKPMALARDNKGPALVVSLSDNRIHWLQMAKLVALAKQDVVRRVSRDLISTQKPRSLLSYDNQNHSAAGPSAAQQDTGDGVCIITIDLASMAEWSLELAQAPIQMEPIERQSSAGGDQVARTSQLLVTSRYFVDLFSASGQHLWSQRFESPLICAYAYTLPAGSPADPPKENSEKPEAAQQVGRTPGRGLQDRMLCLICTDCLSADKCNLIVLEEERIAWSALLNTRPMQVWRTNLIRLEGAIGALDSRSGHLSISYLGTNLDCDPGADELNSEATEGAESKPADQMSHLDDLCGLGLTGDESLANGEAEAASRLEVDVCLEATDQWPNIQVNCRIKIRPEVNSSKVFQNIVATLEFDDLLEFKSADSLAQLSSGVVQVQLGSCWPDRREPITFSGQFSMRATCLDPLNDPSASDESCTGRFNQQVRDENSMPRSLKVRLYLRFNVLHCGPLLQEDSFMLPINMISQLAHIDYSTGQNQTLDDVMANLNLYKRQPSSFMLAEASSPVKVPYFMCDLFVKMNCDMMDLLDELIESDLVCRGFNSENSNSNLHKPKDPHGKESSILENISLLAQSLDCRLKYNNLARSSTPSGANILRQSSEEHSPTVMVSIALKIFNGANLIPGLTTDELAALKHTIVWLHLCDLLQTNNSSLCQEVVRLHANEWKAYEGIDKSGRGEADSSGFDKPVLISIECDHPQPILFLQSHLVERLKRRARASQADHQFVLGCLTDTRLNSLKLRPNEILGMDNFVAISVNLHETLSSAQRDYEGNLKCKFKQLKDELTREYCKFHVATMTSLSLSKRLINLPDNMHQQFSNLSLLTKQYQLNLLRILNELERLKKLDYQYSKVPGTSDIIIIENQEKQPMNWLEFKQVAD